MFDWVLKIPLDLDNNYIKKVGTKKLRRTTRDILEQLT